MCKIIFRNDTLWATGGLGIDNYEKRTDLIKTYDFPRFTDVESALPLPQPRVLHCLLAINQSHLFLHGGNTPMFPDKAYGRTFKYVLNTYKRRLGIEEYNNCNIKINEIIRSS